jgi:hypothetical protein
MEEVFIAFFDFLGFKDFILNNDDEHQIRRMGHIFRDLEIALGQGKFQSTKNGLILSDLSQSKLHALNISDTIIFWTKDTSEESLKEILMVAYDFNWRENTFNFPIRGAVTRGRIRNVDGGSENSFGSKYAVRCLYGEGVVKAYEKAESQLWAGTVIDNSIIGSFTSMDKAIEFLDPIAIKYIVPYKNFDNKDPEYVFRFVVKGKLNSTAYNNLENSIKLVFSQDNKGTDHPSVKSKLQNTLDFIEWVNINEQ